MQRLVFMLTLLVMFAVLRSGNLQADEILLKTGNVIVGKIVHETATSVTIRVSLGAPRVKGQAEHFIEMTLEKKRIRRITRDANIFRPMTHTRGTPAPANQSRDPDIVPMPEVSGDDSGDTTNGKDAARPAAKVRAEGKKDKEPELDPALQAKADSLITAIAKTRDQKRREAMEKELVAIGKDVGPTLIRALKSASEDYARISLIRAIRALGDKRGVQALIDQLRGNERHTIRMRYAWKTLKAITGQRFDFDFTQKREGFDVKKRNREIARWQKWFNSVKDTYPEQVK